MSQAIDQMELDMEAAEDLSCDIVPTITDIYLQELLYYFHIANIRGTQYIYMYI